MSNIVPSNIPGILLMFQFTGGMLNILKRYTDDFSSAEFIDDDLIVMLQSGINAGRDVEKLAMEYKKSPENFIPDRYLAGSFIIADLKRHKVIFGRDRRIVFRMYHFYDQATKIHYAVTNLNMLSGKVCSKLNPEALDSALQTILFLPCLSLYEGVNIILPGHVRVIGVSEETERIFWRAQLIEYPSNYEDAVKRYAELLTAEVRSEMPTGQAALFLSGGSDSATVSGILAKNFERENILSVYLNAEGRHTFEEDDVKSLEKQLNLNTVYAKLKPDDILNEIGTAVELGSFNSFSPSFPMFMNGARQMSQYFSRGTPVFNGELCILDVGFTNTSDRLRALRRWLFCGGGRFLSHMPLLPGCFNVNWSKYRKSDLNPHKCSDAFWSGGLIFREILTAIGRPDKYFMGMELGYRSFPGIFLGRSYLPPGYPSTLWERLEGDFMKYHRDGLLSENWRPAFTTFVNNWYAEAHNMSMHRDASLAVGLTAAFPFCSVDTFDFCSSIPREWGIDKKIQKDMGAFAFGLPDTVAYRKKTSQYPGPSASDILYSKVEQEMLSTIRSVDFGPLSNGIHEIIKNASLLGRKTNTWLFCLFAASLKIKQDHLSVG